ncbi:MAG: hypothetical protein LWW77_03270 [Propionibacteriales bacterium]|nr:hypothetical protein [Propionibacteriales bacterium]
MRQTTGLMWRASRGLSMALTLLLASTLASCASGGVGGPATTGGAPAGAASSAAPTRLPPFLGMDTSKGHNDAQGLWAKVDLPPEDEWSRTPSQLLEQQRDWKRAIDYDFPADSAITCDPRTFVPLDKVMLINIAVIGDDKAAVMAAMTKAQERLYRVDSDGREYSEAELDKLLSDGPEVMTPAYLSDPEAVGLMVGIDNIDLEGERYTWYERTAMRIVAEELVAAKATPARITPFLTPDVLEWIDQSGDRLPNEGELR